MKPVQYFSDEYLEQCKAMSTKDIINFLEGFRELHLSAKPDKSRLISIKIPENLLTSFRTKAELNGLKYQSQIKNLMQEWVKLSKD